MCEWANNTIEPPPDLVLREIAQGVAGAADIAVLVVFSPAASVVVVVVV